MSEDSCGGDFENVCEGDLEDVDGEVRRRECGRDLEECCEVGPKGDFGRNCRESELVAEAGDRTVVPEEEEKEEREFTERRVDNDVVDTGDVNREGSDVGLEAVWTLDESES